MSDAAVTFLLESLAEVISREADSLIAVGDKVEWIETEFKVMVPHLQAIESLPHLPEYVRDCVESSRAVILRAEDVIGTYARKAALINIAPLYKRTFHWLKSVNQYKEIERIKDEIIKVRQRWTNVNFGTRSLKNFDFGSSSSSSDHAYSSFYADAMKKLENLALGGRDRNREHLERVEWVRDELAPLHSFLEQTINNKNNQLLNIGERQKLWIYELSNIFQFVNDSSFPTTDNNIDDQQQLLLVNVLLSVIQSKILDLYRRYFTYGIGEFIINSNYGGVTSTSTLIISQIIRMSSPVPGASGCNIYQVKGLIKEINYLRTQKFNLSKEYLKVDLKLMKALVEDGRWMKDKDERLKVWLNQMGEISADLEALNDEQFSSHRASQIEDEICEMIQRKMMYGICGPVGECRLLYFPATEDYTRINILKASRRELQLTEALFKDVKTHVQPLDARLKLWLEDVQVVERVLKEFISNTSEYISRPAFMRCRELHKRFFLMYEWKHTYNVGDVKSGLDSSSFDHQLGVGEATLHASKPIDEEIDLIRREIKLMHALDSDIISRMGELDGTTEAWVVEMRNIARDAEDMLSINYSNREVAIDRIKVKMRELSERKLAYGIYLNSNDVRDDSNTYDIDQMQGRSDSLDRNNNNPSSVPSYLKQCIKLFSLFPPNFEVPARRLKVLWFAEGLVRQNKDETVEHVSERYLEELISLDLVIVKKRKLNGKVKACQLSDEARDKWLPKAEESRFFRDKTGTIIRLVDHYHLEATADQSMQNYRNVISFLSLNTQEGRKPGEGIGKFIDKNITYGCFLELRILDLEQVFRPKLPESVSKLVRLRYIGLRWTYLEQLPEFVNKLLNLQVLDVKHTYISTLPKSIWSMQFLRHLYLSETYRTRFIARPLSATSTLTRLQTLWGAFVDETTCVKQGLDTLLNIRKLGISCRSTLSGSSVMSEQLEAVDKWISNLEFLESLRLKSRDKNGNPSDLHLNSLKNHGKLSTVYLLGKLKPSVVYEFPLNLIDITLSSSELETDPMSSLEKLPNLVTLRLLSKSVMCDRMCNTKKGFPQLKVLKLWKLPLKNWEIEKGAMPCLEDLEIRSCVKLEMLPDGLQHLTKLKKLKLTRMPKRFVDDTEDRQAKLLSKIEHVFEFDPVGTSHIN